MKKKTKRQPDQATFEIRLPVLRTPLDAPVANIAEGLKINGEAEHAFFLRCCELFRVVELLQRIQPSLIETYSKYRTRDQFHEALNFRYFDSDLSLVAQFQPDLAATQISMFNLLYELRISLAHADALPYTVKGEIDIALAILTKQWAEFRQAVFERYGWQFRDIGALSA